MMTKEETITAIKKASIIQLCHIPMSGGYGSIKISRRQAMELVAGQSSRGITQVKAELIDIDGKRQYLAIHSQQ